MITKFLIKNSIITKWISSYLVIVVILISINGIIYFQSARMIQDEAVRANQAILNQVRQAIDNNMKDVRQLALSLSLDDRIRGLMYTDSNLEVSQRYTISQLIKNLKALSSVNGFIEDFYIYFSRGDFIVGPSAYYLPEIAFDHYHRDAGISFDQWKEMLNHAYDGEYLMIPSKTSPKERIVYAQSLPLGGIRYEATLIVRVNQEQLYSIIESFEWVNQGFFSISSPKMSLLYNSDSEYADYVRLNYGLLDKDQDVFEAEFNGEKVIVSYISSEVINLKYISVIPAKIFMHKSLYIWRLTAICLVFCLFFGTAAAYLFSKRNYQPIQELLGMIKEGIPKNKGPKEDMQNIDEIRYIQKVVGNLFDEKESITKKMQEHSHTINENYWIRLMEGRLVDEKEIAQELPVGIYLKSSFFAIALLNIDDDSMFFTNFSAQQSVENRKLIVFMLENVLQELTQPDHQCFIVEIDKKLAVILNIKEADHQKMKSSLYTIITQFKSFFDGKLGIRFSIGISTIKFDLVEFSKGYEEAKAALEYKQIVGNNTVILYDEIQANNKTYHYSLQIEYQLINCIKAGDYDKAKEIMDYIFKLHFSNKTPSLNIAKCLMFDLTSTMIKAMDAVSEVINEETWKEMEPIDKLMECQTVNEMKNEMEHMCYQICSFIHRNKKNQNEERKEKIIAFIEDSYKDVNLNVGMIAEHFGLNPSYISRDFKDQTGEGLLDFINGYRVEKAKVLLENENASVSDTAIAVGYQNSVSLIRVFKKYEGVTPGQYRDMIRKKE